MAFTGAAVRQGNSTRFGVDSVGSTPRAFVSFGGEPYVITRNGLIHITDLENGSGVLIQNNSNYDLSSPDPTCGFAYNSRLYFLDRGGSALQIFNDPLTGDVSLIDFYSGITTPAGAATDGTTVWVYDSTFDALHTINPDTAATTLLGTVGFDVTTPANNIGGMFYHGGSLYLLDNGTELLFVIEDPSAATLEATAVDVNVVEFGASQRGVNGGSVHDGEAYMAGGNPDALYRFYNVRWDETIAAVEVDAGGNGSFDLSTVSRDATSFEFVSSSPPSWLTISGNDLVITGAPDVTSDTDYSPEVRAVRSSFHEDETLTVRVAAVGSMIVTPSEPRSLLFSTFENSIVVSWDEASDNGGESPTRFDVRIDGGSWISTGLDTFYAFGSLSPATEYTIEVAQVNSAGRGAIASGTATTNSVPIVVPGAPTSLSLSETHSSIVAAWAAANDNGGEAPIRFDIRIDGGSWIDTGLDPTHTFSNLSAETEYLIEVAQVNSAGRGTIASERVTTDAAPLTNTAPSFSQSFYAFTDVAIAVNTIVGTVAATDADNDTLSYSLTGTDAAKFDIDSAGEIRAAAALNYGENYNFKVVADDGTESVSVAVTIHTQTISLPGILLFKNPLNRITTPAVAGDNNYSTYTDRDTVTISIDQAGTAQTFDALFFKMMNVTSYIVEVDGVALPARTVPQHLTGVSELGDVSILRHGYQQDLYELSTAQSGSTVEITFTGSNIRISEVWVLKQIAVLQKLKGIAHSQIDRDSESQSNLYGYEETEVITGLDRLRWRSEVELEFTHTDANYEVFLDMIEDHAEAGIVVAQEPRRLPWRTYQAIFSKLSHAAPYLSSVRPAGNTVQFVMDETREAGPLWYSMDTFNSNDSGDGLMFFKPCPHLFQNGAVDDNDYKTSSTQTTHTFDVEAVSHIFVKAKGVTGYAVQTRVSNAWVTQQTITPAQKTYRGYDNSLTQLTTRLEVDQVRLVFTGTNIEIYEVMCLDRGGEILTDTQSLLSKTDRTGIIHEGQGGGLERSRVRASQRMKWGIQVNATFGHFDDFVVDDVLDWINAYPNFVFSYLPNDFPWRTFPATWTDTQFQQAFLTTILQNGDYLQMNVKER